MIFDGEKKVYILSEQEYDEMFDGKAHANLELIKARDQFADLSKKVERLQEQLGIARIVLGQIAMFSSDKEDCKQCAKAIKEINEVCKDDKGN